MPLDDPCREFIPLAPWPLDLRYRDAPTTERILQNQLPARADPCSYTGSSALYAAQHDFAEGGNTIQPTERRARDAERQRQKRAAARA